MLQMAKLLASTLLWDYYYSRLVLIEIQDVYIKAIARHWKIPFCPTGNVIFLLNVLSW